MAVTVQIRRSSTRFPQREPGRLTQHSFSFGAAYDPDRLRLGPMVCHDDHLLSQGSGFPSHRHSGLEIVTWVVSGALEHSDATGSTVLRPGSVAVLSTGAGVEHAEIAAAPQTRFIQVWLTAPDDAAAEPSYRVTPVAAAPGSGLVTAARPRPDAAFAVARLRAGESVTLPAGALQHVFVATGALGRSSLAEPLAAGDAFVFTDEPEHTLTATVPAELLVWSFDAQA